MENPYNSVDLFFDAARRDPGKTAIIQGGEQITYGELERQVVATAGYFQSKGITKGDSVLVFVPMSIDLYRIVLALFRIGATAVFLDEWVSRKRLEACCKVVPCKAWIGGWKVRLLSFTSIELLKIPVKMGLSYTDGLPFHPVETTGSDTALITFTTGSTGTPKAAKRTHGFLRAQFAALIDTIRPEPEDIDMPVLPIVLMINLGVGCTSVIAPFKPSKPERMDADAIIALIREHQVNRLIASPFFIKRIAETAIAKRIDLTGVRKVFTGGAPVFPNDASVYQKSFTESLVEIVYGSTESEPISSISANELVLSSVRETGGLAVGMPYHGTTVKIIGMTDAPIVCKTPEMLEEWQVKAGEIGEIIVSGDHVLREYINNEDGLRRNKIFIGEACWHRTGDSGFLDAAGALFLTGRCGSLIEHNGALISMFIVENELQSLEEIVMGTVLKVKEKIVSVIELKRGFSSNEQFNLKLKNLLPFLDELVEVKRMPRDPRHHSKIDYSKLTELMNR